MTTEAEFRSTLESDGFTVLDVNWPADHENSTHTHDFTARGLCLSGSFTIVTDTWRKTCGPGDTFEMAAGCLHSEAIGPDGAKLVVGRR